MDFFYFSRSLSISSSSKKVDPTLVKKTTKPKKKVPRIKKQKASQRYVASFFGYTKFCDERSKNMWDIVCQRKILSERLINVDKHEKTGVYKFDRTA